MSQSDSGIGILDLAKQAGARKSILKKLVLQCIQERGEATEGFRLERQVSLRKMTQELRSDATAVIADMPPANFPHGDIPKGVSPEARPVAEPGLQARMSGLEDALHLMGQTLTERLDLLSVDRAVDPTAAALLEVVDGLGAKLAVVDQKVDVLRGDYRNIDLSVGHLSGQVKSIDQIFASLGRDANKLGNTIEALSSDFRKSQDRVAQIESALLSAEASRAAELEPLLKELEGLKSQCQSLESRAQSLESRAQSLESHGQRLESPGVSAAEFSHLQTRFLELEAGFERVLTTVQDIERPTEEIYTDAEQEATAKVLASLTKLVEGMRSTQGQRQVEKGVQRP